MGKERKKNIKKDLQVKFDSKNIYQPRYDLLFLQENDYSMEQTTLEYFLYVKW